MRNDIAGPETESTTAMWEGLEGVVREKAQEFIQQILEEEVTELLGREKSERKAAVDAAPGYRNGYGKARRLSMSSGTITVRRPRVRGLEERFESRVLPLFARRTKEVGELIPELYLHGLAEEDFELALRGLLGEGAPLSKASIRRLRAVWSAAHSRLRDVRERRRRRDRHGSGARGRTALAAARRRRPAAGRSGPPGDDRSPPRADPERLRLRLECAPRARLEGGGTPRARLSELPPARTPRMACRTPGVSSRGRPGSPHGRVGRRGHPWLPKKPLDGPRGLVTALKGGPDPGTTPLHPSPTFRAWQRLAGPSSLPVRLLLFLACPVYTQPRP